jgi:hypothetical protein
LLDAVDKRPLRCESGGMSDTFPVLVAVKRPDGSTENVRVGSAVREGDAFVLSLGTLSIGTTPEAPRRPAPVAVTPSGGGAGGGEVFPPYGRSKGAPVRGATKGDLEYYANGCRRSLDDASKSRWHEKERQLLAAIEAELARQGGGGGSDTANYGGPRGAPAPADYGDYSAPSRGFSAPPDRGDDTPPPYSDDDIPF